MTLKEKLDLWVKITGIDPSNEKNAYTINLNEKMSDYDIKKMNDKIMESLNYDDTGLFAEAYLSVYFEEFIKDMTFTIFEILENPDIEKYIKDIEKLRNAIRESNASNSIMREAFKAMDFYGLKHDLLNLFDIIELRTSAIRCMNGKLRILQFSSGKPSTEGFKMTKDIYMYRDIDALLLSAVNNTINGVSLGYIRNKERITDSYFAFIIKNGQNLYLLTDMPNYKHPLQNTMTRCPGRDMYDRINSNFFPYDTVAKIDTSDLWGVGRYGTNEKSTELATILNDDTLRIKIGSFDTMDQQEAFWTIMMISLIKKKFYDDVPQYEISYAGSMIQSHQLETKDYALCIRTNLPFIELKDISFEETINMEFDGYKDQKGMNDYLIERYKKDIDKEALNLIKGTERFEKMNQKYTINGAFESKKYLLVPLDINACGTKEEILYNQKWIERYNYAQQINVLLNADYEAHAENIKRNVEQIINSRIREIVKMHIKNQLKKIRLLQRPMGGINDFEKKEVSFSSIKTFDRWYNGNISSTYKYGYSSRSTKAEMRCAFTGKSPCVVITINPENIEELSLICGCKVTDFPEQIQHWSKQEIYYGNPILENIDPMLWVIEDPFNKINFDITILLSKKAYLEICEEAGVRPDKLWEKERPLCHNSKEETCSGSYKYNNIGYNVYKQLKIKCLKCPWYKDNIESTKLKRN